MERPSKDSQTKFAESTYLDKRVTLQENIGGKEMLFVEKKIIKSGNIYELYIYQKPYCTKRKPITARYKVEKSLEEQLITKQNNERRSRHKLQRLINANIGQYKESDKFLTLTFKENITDRKHTNYEFMKFIQRLKYEVGEKEFEYIGVVEKQKRGAIHYHVIFFGLPFIKANKLKDLWSHGNIKVNKINIDDGLSSYLSKYITKDLDNGRNKKEKRYLSSKGLMKPLEYFNDGVDELIGDNVFEELYSQTIENEWLGKLEYSRLILIKE